MLNTFCACVAEILLYCSLKTGKGEKAPKWFINGAFSSFKRRKKKRQSSKIAWKSDRMWTCHWIFWVIGLSNRWTFGVSDYLTIGIQTFIPQNRELTQVLGNGPIPAFIYWQSYSFQFFLIKLLFCSLRFQKLKKVYKRDVTYSKHTRTWWK